LETVETLPGPDHRFLHGVFGVGGRTKHPVAVARESGTMGFERNNVQRHHDILSGGALQPCQSSPHSDTFGPVTSGGILVCWRPIEARAGEEHIVTRVIRQHGLAAVQTTDTTADLGAFDVVLLLEHANWFPRVLRQLERGHRAQSPGPLLAVWHWEPLPMPAAAHVAAPRLSARELAKIVLRDSRATDIHTNLRR